MNKKLELIFLFSVFFLQIASFLPFGIADYPILSGDNLILAIGLVMIAAWPGVHRIKLSDTTKYAFIAGVILLFIIPSYLVIKDTIVFGYAAFDINTLAKRAIRLIFIYFFLKYLSSSLPRFRRGMLTLVYLGILITLSMFFEDLFTSLGFSIRNWKIGPDVDIESETLRHAGISGMNVNDLGALLGTLVGILFLMIKSKLIRRPQAILFFGFLSVGVLFTGSRSAFVILVIVSLFFVGDTLKKFSFQSLFLTLFFLFTAYTVFQNFATVTVGRIEELSTGQEFWGLGTRMGYWALYLLDINNNPIYLLVGNLALPTYHRSAHNYYIQIVFKTGIIFLGTAFYFIYKFIRAKKKQKSKDMHSLSLDYKYVLIPQLLNWISSASYMSWIALIAFGIVGITFYRREKESANLNKQSIPHYDHAMG